MEKLTENDIEYMYNSINEKININVNSLNDYETSIETKTEINEMIFDELQRRYNGNFESQLYTIQTWFSIMEYVNNHNMIFCIYVGCDDDDTYYFEYHHTWDKINIYYTQGYYCGGIDYKNELKLNQFDNVDDLIDCIINYVSR